MQGTNGSQRCLIKNPLAAPLLDPGRCDIAMFIDQHQDKDFAFQPESNRFGWIKQTKVILFF